MLPIQHSMPQGFLNQESKELVVSTRTKKVWAVLLDLLLEFDRVCRKNNIQYFIDGGTLLGAARHKGFIPWDDDVDVIMFRNEYEKLCKCATNEFASPYFFQTNDTDPGTLRGHAQLRNSATTGILKSEMENGRPRYGFNQGMFLDVFILDKIPDDDKEFTLFSEELRRLKQRPITIRNCIEQAHNLVRGRMNYLTLRYGWKGLYYILVSKIRRVDLVDEAYKIFEAYAQKYNGEDSARCAAVSFQPKRPLRKLLPLTMFRATVSLPFEGHDFPAPIDWEDYLERHYGNWHEHVIGGCMHGGLLADPEKPYTEYLKK